MRRERGGGEGGTHVTGDAVLVCERGKEEKVERVSKRLKQGQNKGTHRRT